MTPVIALLLVAVSLGLSNFAAAIGLGTSGVDQPTRLRVAVIFGAFEVALPALGLLLGQRVRGPLGASATYIGAGLLIVTGAYGLIAGARGPDHPIGQVREVATVRVGRLLITGLALSVDNLAVGFALGAYRVNVAVAATLIGAVSVALSLIGLELGNVLGARIGQRGELLGSAILIVLGVAIGLRVI